MKLTKAGEYAIRCILFLATREGREVVGKKLIASEMDIPESFLSKVAQALAKAELIEITQGAKGGYRLVRRPKDISLLEVIESVEGNISLNQCILRKDSCERSPMCAVHRVWEEARGQLRKVLAEADFATLAERELLSKRDCAGPLARVESGAEATN